MIHVNREGDIYTDDPFDWASPREAAQTVASPPPGAPLRTATKGQVSPKTEPRPNHLPQRNIRSQLHQEWLLMPEYWFELDDVGRHQLARMMVPKVMVEDQPSWPSAGYLAVWSAFR